jgi:hypothetical protein
MVRKKGFLMEAGPDLLEVSSHIGVPSSGRDGDRWVIISCIPEPHDLKATTNAAIASPIAGVRE